MEKNRSIEGFGGVTRRGPAGVVVENLEVDDAVLAELLDRRPPEQWADLVRRALAVGARGLVDMGLGLDIDQLDGRVRATLDAVAAEARACTAEAIESARMAFAEHFDPDLRTSLVGKTLGEFAAARDDLLARLDPASSGTHTGRFIGELAALLGPQGMLETRLRDALDPEADGSALGRLAQSIDERLCELRDAVMREAGRAVEAERGTAKGVEFEDVVEELLREAGRPWGALVERLGRDPGRLGPESVVGDFVIELPGGRRIVVEAKNTARIALTGRHGILEELDRAMANRDAEFGICVSAGDAFPGEVGAFGAYGNRVLIVDEGDGVLLGVALRWAQAVLAGGSGSREELDAAALVDRMERLRAMAQRFSASRRALSDVKSSVEAVREQLEAMRGEMLEVVEDVVREVRSTASGEDAARRVA